MKTNGMKLRFEESRITGVPFFMPFCGKEASRYTEIKKIQTFSLHGGKFQLQQGTGGNGGRLYPLLEAYQEEYQRRYTALTERYAAARARMTDIDALRLERTAKRANIMRFLKMLVKQGDLITEFDEELWYITVESVTVYADQRLLLTFRDGSEIAIEPDIWKAA